LLTDGYGRFTVIIIIMEMIFGIIMGMTTVTETIKVTEKINNMMIDIKFIEITPYTNFILVFIQFTLM